MTPKLLSAAPCTAARAAASVHPSRAESATAPPVPADLRVPEGNRAFLVMHAIGTQNYICLTRPSAPGLGWTLTGPQATLFDDELGQQLTHFLSVNPVD